MEMLIKKYQILVKLRMKFLIILNILLHKYLTAENFVARLKQAHLVNKADFDNKLTRFNKRITSNKTKYLEVKKKLNSLATNLYHFFLGRMYFTSNDGSQNIFIYQPTLDTLELEKHIGTNCVLS